MAYILILALVIAAGVISAIITYNTTNVEPTVIHVRRPDDSDIPIGEALNELKLVNQIRTPTKTSKDHIE